MNTSSLQTTFCLLTVKQICTLDTAFPVFTNTHFDVTSHLVGFYEHCFVTWLQESEMLLL